MRIAMLSKAVVIGAYQRKLEELACIPGVELTVLAPTVWRDSRGETRLERRFTQGYRLVETSIAFSGHFHVHFYPRLGRDLALIGPDLLHIDEEPYNVAAWQAMRWAASDAVPALFFTWQNLLRRYPPPFNWFERHNYRHAAHAIAGNQEAASVLQTKGFARSISVIPQFGVDPALFHPPQRPQRGPYHPAREGVVVGYAGGLIPEKGVASLLRAVAACNRATERDDADSAVCHVLIAGQGPEKAALAALADDLGMMRDLTFLGRIGSTAMPDFYASIDILVLPSLTMPNWKEQFGRVLIEAMACGVPVIGSSSGEIPHVIGEAGLVFPEGDVNALAQSLAELARSPEARRRLGQRGRQRVLAHYTQQRIAEETYAVYRQILGT